MHSLKPPLVLPHTPLPHAVHFCSLSAAAGKLVCQLLHLPALTPAPLSMRQLMESQDGNNSSSREPVLFITTPGADPSQELAAYAEGQVRCIYMQQQQQQQRCLINSSLRAGQRLTFE
jgi:hypothetical protein